MLEFDGVIGLLLLGLWIFCIFDAITAPADEVRNLPKGLWIFLVIILSDIGSILWLIAGRPLASSARPGGLPYKGNQGRGGQARRLPRQQPSARSIAPDDDPEFLAQLRASNDEHQSMLDKWEADLRRREEELRRKPDDPAPEPGQSPA